MQRTKQDGNDVLPYGFNEDKMSSVPLKNARDPRRSIEKRTLLDPVPEDTGGKLENGTSFPDDSLVDENLDENKQKDQLDTYGKSRFGICKSFRDRLRWARRKCSHSSVSPSTEVNLHMNAGVREKNENIPMHQPTASKEENALNNFTPSPTQRGCSFVCFISVILVVIFIMSATSLTLVTMIINGKIVTTEEAVASPAKEASKHEKQTGSSINAEEMQTEILKLKEELTNTRRELRQQKKERDSKIENLKREILEIKKFTQGGMANITTKVCNCTSKTDNVHFELKLNSSQQLVMKMLSDINKLWSTLNNTDKELREETRSLQAKGNLTQGDIQEVSDSLTKLKAKVLVEEKRLNETVQLKERHSNDVENLTMLINTTRMEMTNKLDHIWKSVNSSGKDQQGNAEISRIWLAINNTKMDLKKQINNISRLAGPIGPPGFNGSRGPAGPQGSIGPPGPKGAGNFSACQYKVKTGTTSGGDTDAFVDEPSGSIIIAAACSTNHAEEYNLGSAIVHSKRRYICNCKGSSSKFVPIQGASKTCFLHYWLCPKT